MTTTSNINFSKLTASQLVDGYRKGNFSPVEVTQAALDRISNYHGTNKKLQVNAFVFFDEKYAENALKEAASSQERWRKGEQIEVNGVSVDGVPITVKDLLTVAGWPTRKGSKATSDKPSQEDAPPVARLREAGAVFLGKTTTPEFGYKGVTDSLLTGTTRNPWNLERTSGGSSGGAAVATALGLGTLHLSSDGGGSSRIPGAFTGVIGFKPTSGRVANYPPSHTGTLAHPGINVRTVEDVAVALNFIARPDPRDWYALPDDGQDYVKNLVLPGNKPLAKLKIAYSPTFGDYQVDPQIAEVVDAAVNLLSELGATVERVDPGEKYPILWEALKIYETFWGVSAAKLVRSFTLDQVGEIEEGLRITALYGERINIHQYCIYSDKREELGRSFELFHQEYDLLVTPTVPIPAFQVNTMYPIGSPYYKEKTNWTPFTYPFNLTGQPAISVPCGLTEKEKLPVGLQIVGAKYQDLLVLQVAKAYESLAGDFQKPPIYH